MGLWKDIIRLYENINSIYYLMLNLEYEGNVDSFDFIQLIEELKSKLIEEEILVNKIIDNYDRDYNKIDELIDSNIGNYSVSFSIRIKDYINNYKNLNEYNDEEVDIEEEMNRRDFLAYSKLYDCWTRNIFLIYLSILQENIDLDMMGDIKEQLLGYKYYNSLINHNVENQLFSNYFIVNKVNYMDLYMNGAILGIDEESFFEIITDIYMDTITTSIEQLLSIYNDDYMDDRNRARAINIQSMMRAGLLMMDDNYYDRIESNVLEYIDEYSNDNNSISLDIINAVLNNKNRDKCRVMKLSFGFFGKG